MNPDSVFPHESCLLTRLFNIVASVALVVLGCGIFAALPHNRPQMISEYGWDGFSFTGTQYLCYASGVYMAALVVYYLAVSESHTSKSLRFIRVVARFLQSPLTLIRQGLDPVDRLAVLSTLLKGFFAPFMVMVLMKHVLGAISNGSASLSDVSMGYSLIDMFNRHGYWLALKIIFFADVVVFTFGYLVEMPRLKNEIRSVDPTVLGWTAALLCYPPFNTMTAAVLGSTLSEFPQFDDPMTHVLMNVMLLVLMAIYASASVALGLKASNLTHRGIVARGPYAWVRHPAYAAKNMAWWIGSLPLVAASFSQSTVAGVTAVASVMGWSLLYVLRAVTEEDHLRSVDSEYAAYAARVRHRFIPGVV